MFCKFRKIKPFDFTLPCTSINTINSVCRVPERDLKGFGQISTIAKQVSENKFKEEDIYQNRRKVIDLDFQLSIYNQNKKLNIPFFIKILTIKYTLLLRVGYSYP